MFKIRDPRSRILGVKKHWIPDPDLQHFLYLGTGTTTVFIYKVMWGIL
jgi:hypothetical protein